MSDEIIKQEKLKQQLATLNKQYDQEVMNYELKFLDLLHNEFQRFCTQNQLPVSHVEKAIFHIRGRELTGKVSTIEYDAFNCRLMSSSTNVNKFFIKVHDDLWIVDICDKSEPIHMPAIAPQMFSSFSNTPRTIEDDISQMLKKIKNYRGKERFFKYYCEKENGMEIKYHLREEENFFEMITDIFMKYE